MAYSIDIVTLSNSVLSMQPQKWDQQYVLLDSGQASVNAEGDPSNSETQTEFTPCSSSPGPCTPIPTSVPSPSGSKSGAAAPFRPLFNDFGPPSMGFVREMKSPAPRTPRIPYKDLLSVIEEMSKEIRPTYAGSKSTMKGLKRDIIHARALVGECLAETEWSVRTKQEAPQPQGLDLSWPLQSTRFSLAFIPSCTSHPGLPVLCPLVGALQEPRCGSHSRWQH
ncbi:PREDICTED: cyclin-dependent kinase 2-associated protein 2-like [Mandrillus leucophaeus]|uniref:cyclin-dependent kinase 2-associated protein 2-like n=1 Tax=Mandrillus leucophaeus TaxID=9568 RepID=UPI0005F506E2|nr:PREDICTED: cyclin-dependent kinase 2-associated protein 2-like [Mandrillus leucophaeus]